MRRIGGAWCALASLAACLLLHGRCDAAPPERPAPTAVPKAWEFTDLAGSADRIEWPAREPAAVAVFFFDLRKPESLLGLSFFDALSSQARDFGLRVIGVEATGRPPAEVREAMQGFAAVYRTPSFPVVADPNAVAARRFGSPRAPASLLMAASGDVVARTTGFDVGTAVELARGVERLLGRNEGFFSPALRAVGVGEARERELGVRTAAAAAAAERADLRPLAWGDRLPAFDFTDTAGRAGRWSWPAGGVIRIVIFWSGASAGADEVLTFFDGLRRREGGEFLEILAIEASGLDAGVVAAFAIDGGRRRVPLAIPLVPDPQRLLVGLFGAGDPLPQSFLIDGRGDVLFRADGFGPEVQKTLEDKIARAGRLAGLGLPQAPNEVSRPGTAADGGEAPSISRRLERDKELQFNLSRADYFFIGGQYERALLHYQRYLELEPGSLHALVRLAQSYDLLGDPARAREHWERVLAVSPDHEEARRRLSELQRPAGR